MIEYKKNICYIRFVMTSVEETMKSISKVMLLSTSFLFRFEAAYALADADAFPAFQRNGTHTHYTTNLAPYPHLSSAQSADRHNLLLPLSRAGGKEYKEASVCFITDTGACRDLPYDIPDYNICVEEGFPLTSCPEFYTPYNYCPYDNKYFAECREMCPDYVECNDPYYGVGEPCNGKYERCECDTCPGYVFESEIPRGYHKVGEACNSCDGLKYKYEINSCDGFMECADTGPEEGAEVCWRGDTPTYSSCKPCANLGDLDSCPAHYVCKYEDCSKKYYKTGCEEGYIWDEAAKTCTPECDPNDRTCQCPGKHYCDPDTKVGDGKTCTTADGTTYYDRCLVKETCFQADYNQNGLFCSSKDYIIDGEYYVKDQCTTQGGKTYRYYASCNSNGKDCAGNDAPCKGFKDCSGTGPDIGAQSCQCGKKVYYDKCESCSTKTDYSTPLGNCMGRNIYTVAEKSYQWGDAIGTITYYVEDYCQTSDKTKAVIGTWYCNETRPDCSGQTPPCAGYKRCTGYGKIDAKECFCGDTTFYSECDACVPGHERFPDGSYSCYNYGTHNSYNPTQKSYNYGDAVYGTGYFVKDKCRTEDGTHALFYYQLCNATVPDCMGKMPPAAGKKICPSGTWATNPVKCGDNIYGDECISECTFEDTAETCAAKGQSFEQKCYGSKNGRQVWFGECK